jgi:Domain of unknown function (DUF4136)
MKPFKFLPLLLLVLLTSCSSTIKVNYDYDKKATFEQYKTFAFHQKGISQLKISDLDKRRILGAIEEQMIAKGFTKSETPDLLINVFTEEHETVDVTSFNNNWGYGWGWGWNPYWGGNSTTVSKYVEGTLFIDFIDAQKKELVWQGQGSGVLTQKTNEKDQLIKDFVTKILAQYPPQKPK